MNTSAFRIVPYLVSGVVLLTHLASRATDLPQESSVTPDELANMKQLSVDELGAIMLSGDKVHARYAATELTRDAHAVYGNFGRLETALRGGAGASVAEELAGAIKRMPCSAEKEQVIDQFTGYLKEVLDTGGPIGRSDAIRLMGESIYIDSRVTPRYGTEQFVQVLNDYLNDTDYRVRGEVIKWLGYVAVNDLSKTEKIVGLLEAQRAKGGHSGESEALAFVRRSLAPENAAHAQLARQRLNEEDITSLYSMTREELGEIVRSGHLYDLRSKYAFAELVRTCGLNDLQSLVGLAMQTSDLVLRPVRQIAQMARTRAADGLTGFIDVFIDVLEQTVDDKGLAWRARECAVEGLYHAIIAPTTFVPRRGSTYRVYGYDRIVRLLMCCVDDSCWQIRENAAKYLGTVGAYDPDKWEPVLSFLDTQRLKELQRAEEDEAHREQVLSALDSATRNIGRYQQNK